MRRGRLRSSPYARIMLAAKAKRGVRLSRQEVIQLSRDNAIETRGLNDLLERDAEDDAPGSWAREEHA